MERTDYCIIGGGIVGLATAHALLGRAPGATIRVIEKESDLARHQTRNNSGVVHAGVYYEPGSLKAKFCREGGAAIAAFCEQHEIGFDRCGKLIVATNLVEVERLNALLDRCIANGLDPQLLSAEELKEHEPNIAGLAALRIQESAITDYPAITRKMADLVVEAGGDIVLGATVTDLKEAADGVVVTAGAQEYACDQLIVCGGLHADRLARKCDIDIDFRIVPFRGEYFELPAERRDIIRHMIYPTPDPALPFLGIHLTPMIDGRITAGPNAVLALAREGYRWGNIDLGDLAEMTAFRGLRTVLRQNWRSGVVEFRNSLFKKHYLEECRKYCPSLELKDLTKRTAGVRAQAVLADGTMVHDFLIKRTKRTLHVCNAPSPAATSSMAIANHICSML